MNFSCLETYKSALHEAMQHEIDIMRHMLSSLHEEYIAITTYNHEMLDHVIEERLNLISSFEKWSTIIIEVTMKLTDQDPLMAPLRHEVALNMLEEAVLQEDYELLTLKTKVITLLNEIFSKNEQNARLLKEYMVSYSTHHLMTPHDHNPLSVTCLVARERKVKSTVSVIDIVKEK